jgi:hypothetical protein
MKAVITALGILAFAATMAVAKTEKFHARPENGNAYKSYAQWQRPIVDRASRELNAANDG